MVQRTKQGWRDELMRLKGIIAEDFCNYKLPSMFLISAICNWKCCIEQGIDVSVCQNHQMAHAPTIDISDIDIYEAFSNNCITKAVVLGGLEPFMQFDEMLNLIRTFRSKGELCDFIIYTGYYPNEIREELLSLSSQPGIIVKFGRFIFESCPVYDEILGVTLASCNQFALRIS